MTKRNPPAGRAGKIIYWIATIWLSLGMLSTGLYSYNYSNQKAIALEV
jgi:hypothetical protein